eukprot:g36974.t1
MYQKLGEVNYNKFSSCPTQQPLVLSRQSTLEFPLSVFDPFSRAPTNFFECLVEVEWWYMCEGSFSEAPRALILTYKMIACLQLACESCRSTQIHAPAYQLVG